MMEDPGKSAKRLDERAARMERSAKAVEKSTSQFSDAADRRTTLASDRTLLAVERTYAAWVRTALAALAGGVGARALSTNVLPKWVGQVSGTILILFAGFCLVAAVWRQVSRSAMSTPDIRPVPHTLLVPMNGLLLLVALAALIGIWAT